MTQALILIDLQMDYFPGGAYPLWEAEETLQRLLQTAERARDADALVVLVQHLAGAAAPFFREGSPGAELHPKVRAALPEAPRIIKRHADSFHQTELGELLSAHGSTELAVAGMMTQNCVTHTLLSKSAEGYGLTLLQDGCTTVDAMLHAIAVRALAPRVRLSSCAELF